MPRLRIDVFTHNVKCTEFDSQAKQALLSYTSKVARVDLIPDPEWDPRSGRRRRMIRQITKIYAGLRHDRTEFRFHINQYDELMQTLEAFGIWDKDIQFVRHPEPKYVPHDFKLIDKRTPRDYQVEKIEYLKKDQRTKILIAQTGLGKTAMSLWAIHALNKRVFLALTKITYMNKWVEDVEEAYDCKRGDIVVIKGTKQLSTLIECAKNDDLDAKFIICSMRTLQMYIEKYEAGDDVVAEYGCNPEELFEILGVGIRFIDEVHEHFHTVFKLDLYTHVSETINLTATLIDDNVFVERMMRVMFPLNERPPKSPYDKYIETIAYAYGLSDEGRRVIAYKQPGRGSYSHVRFEKFVMKHKKYLKRYLGFIVKATDEQFIGRREDRQRLLVFCSTIAMCELVTKHLKEIYPKLSTAKYTSEDSYETLLGADIVVSTLLSAGTAVDIPDLRTVIMTTAIGSRRQNVQALGRLRRMHNYPQTTPTFVYFVCVDIEEHMRYYEKKIETFEDKTLVHKVEHTSFSL